MKLTTQKVLFVLMRYMVEKDLDTGLYLHNFI
jgi:hypothetical protein